MSTSPEERVIAEIEKPLLRRIAALESALRITVQYIRDNENDADELYFMPKIKRALANKRKP